jgi:hypothetical protein
VPDVRHPRLPRLHLPHDRLITPLSPQMSPPMNRLPLTLALLGLAPAALAQQHDGHTPTHANGPPARPGREAPAAGAPAERAIPLDTTRWTRADVEAFLGTSGLGTSGPEPGQAVHRHDGEAPAAEPPAGDHGHGAEHGDGVAAPEGHGMTGREGRPAGMVSSTSPDEPMSRDASGTAWLPETTPMEAAHYAPAGWSLMLHGAAFLRYTAQDVFEDGTRGARGFGAPSWVMGMAQRAVGRAGVFTARAMLSLDPLIEGGDGYPLLFQSGETFEGERLVDRQHPHDLFSELAVAYARRVGPSTSVFGYVGFPGEPVVGPVAFMHRPSARYNPDSPLGHHWHDATHIAFGVATLGMASGPVKVDASLFTGAEPDEERYGFDRPTFDSYAARLSYSPSPRVTLHASRAFLREPEALEPGVDQWRTTASALYAAPFGADGDLSASLVWGANDLRPDDEAEHPAGVQHAVLAEAALRLGAQAVHGRAEYAQKSAEELALDGEAFHDGVFGVASLTLGAGRDVFAFAGLTAMLGGQGTLYAVPEVLRPVYGRAPVSLQVYLRLSPSRMAHGLAGHAGH